jgi:hypothetical protein
MEGGGDGFSGALFPTTALGALKCGARGLRGGKYLGDLVIGCERGGCGGELAA